MTTTAVRRSYWGLGLLVIVAIGLLSSRSDPPSTGAKSTKPASAEMSASDVRTSLYDDGALKARIAAKTISIERLRLLGPVRVGFLRALHASNVVVETFPRAGAPQHPIQGVGVALQSLVPRAQHARMAEVDLEAVTWVEHREDGRSKVQRAEHCRVTRATGTLICRDRSGAVLDLAASEG